jgi:hypothetical protein
MRRVTITIPDDLEQALLEFQAAQPVQPTLTAIVQTATREYLRHGHVIIPATRPFHITPITPNDEFERTDVSVKHDQVAVEASQP